MATKREDLQTPAPMNARKHKWSVGLAVLCLPLFMGLILLITRLPLSSWQGKSPEGVPIVWTAQQQSMLVQNSTGVFALKEIEITTAKEFRFYYAFKLSHQDTIHVTAVSALNTGQGQSVTLFTSVLSLGMIDDFSVGVIRVQYLDHVGQTIALNITSPEEENVHWQLTPLKQLQAEPHPEGGGYYGFPVDQQLFPEIIWSGPDSGRVGQSMVSLFKNATGTRSIFLEVDYTGKLVVITREQCIQLVGEQVCH